MVQEQIQLINDKMMEKFEQLPTYTKVHLMRLVQDSHDLIEKECYVWKHKEV